MSLARTLLIAGLAVAAAGCASMPTQAHPAKTVHKTLTSTKALPAGTEVKVENLLGHITVQQGGPQLKVTATVVADGKDQAAAQALASTIKLDVRQTGDDLVVHVHYPVNQYDSYQYIPAKGSSDSDHDLHILGFTISHSSSSSTGIKYQDQRVSVYRGRDEGVPLHVDLVVSLPTGSHADIRNHFGPITANNLHADLTLHGDDGDIHARHLVGKLKVDTDSGDTTITDMHGTLVVNADSGDVKLTDIQGDARIDADSGDISAHGIHGNQLKLAADSGDIRVDDVSGTLRINADSGDIWLENLDAVPHLHADSDAGDIVIHGDLSGLAAFDIEADSGDVTLAASALPDVHLDIRGSDVSVDWPSLTNVQSSEDHFSGDAGKATGQGRIHADSGDIRLSR